MIVAVTGATGFLGGWTTRLLLDQGDDVIALVRDESSAEALRLRELGASVVAAAPADPLLPTLEARSCGAILHLATRYVRSHSPGDTSALIRSNVEFGTAVLDAAAHLGVPTAVASSYFQFLGGAPRPSSLYAASKEALMTIARYYRDEAGLPLREVVLYDTYGPGDPREKLIPALVSAAAGARPIRLGSPSQPINLTYAADVARGLVAALAPDATVPAVSTVRAAAPTTVGDVVAVLDSLCGGIDAEFERSRAVSERVLTAGDWPTPPGWTAQVSLEDGLALTLEAARRAG